MGEGRVAGAGRSHPVSWRPWVWYRQSQVSSHGGWYQKGSGRGVLCLPGGSG